MELPPVTLDREQRAGLVRMLGTNFASEYFLDVEAQDLILLLDPDERITRAWVVAEKLEDNEWYGPAADLREGTDPGTIIKRVREMTDDQAELDRAIPLLEGLTND